MSDDYSDGTRNPPRRATANGPLKGRAYLLQRSVTDTLLRVLDHQAGQGAFDAARFFALGDAGNEPVQFALLDAALEQWLARQMRESGDPADEVLPQDVRGEGAVPSFPLSQEAKNHIENSAPFQRLVAAVSGQAGRRRSSGGQQPDAPQKSAEYPLHNSQEWTAIMQAVADGKWGQNYASDDAALTRTHNRPDTPFHTRLALLDEERQAGFGTELLRRITDRLDIDAAFALLYISHCLVPATGLPRNTYAGGWIDLNDVASKIGLRADTAAQAETNRALVWDYIRFGARAHVIGKRSGTYYDVDGKPIQTLLNTPLWTILGLEQPVQPALFEADSVPVRVELVASREWTALTATPATAQYLPLGEVLGAIPGKKPSGAWARSVGLAYVNFCRRNPREARDGSRRPTRKDLLSLFPAKETPYTAFLDPHDAASRNPARLLRYWCEACRLLADEGIFAPEGEAARTEADHKASLPTKYQWVDPWLREEVDLRPGVRLLGAVEERANALPVPGKGKRIGSARPNT